MISEDSIQKVKDAAGIVEVVSKRISLKKTGADYTASCPFHKEKTPSFKVHKDKNIFKCFGCGKSGDAIAFVMEYDNISYIPAIEKLAEFYNIELEHDQPVKEYSRPSEPIINVPFELAEFFMKRGITKDTITDFKVTQVTEWMPKAQKEVPTIAFTYYRDGLPVNIKYRAKDKDFKLFKNAELVFYNLDAIKGQSTVIITEGEIDAMSVHQAGFTNVISVPNGAASKGQQQLKYLDSCWDIFEEVKEVILMLDNDDAGKALFNELSRRIGKERCFKIEYPEGCKDANEVLIKHGKDALHSMVTNRKEIPIEGLISMYDMYDDIRNFYDNGYPDGVKIGVPDFDDHMSFMAGQFTTITGIPGSGKSEFTDMMMVQLSKREDWKWGICSFENQPSAIHATKLMEKITGKSFAFRHNLDSRISENELNYAIDFLHRNFHFININQVDVTIDGILQKAKELVMRKGINGLLIDPWNYIEHKIPFGQSETQYISEVLTKVKAFTLTYGIHIFLIAHPVKMAKNNGKYDVPTLYNISGSAHFFNKTDNGLTIYRDFETGLVTTYIQKIRYSWLGKTGHVNFTYNLETRQYQLNSS